MRETVNYLTTSGDCTLAVGMVLLLAILNSARAELAILYVFSLGTLPRKARNVRELILPTSNALKRHARSCAHNVVRANHAT